MKRCNLKLQQLALVLACLLSAVNASAAIRFVIKDIEATPGKTVEIPIYLENDRLIWLFQLDILIPNGFEVVDLHESNRMTKASSSHLNGAMVGDAYRVLSYNDKLESLVKDVGSGVFAWLTVQVPEDASGIYSCGTQNEEIAPLGENNTIANESTVFKIICPVQTPSNALTIGEKFSNDGIYYRVTGAKTVEVTCRDENYNSYRGVVEVPPSVKYGDVTYKVTAIGEKAFYNSSSLTKVVLPTTIKVVKKEAFQACKALKEMNLPEGLESLETYSFAGFPQMTSLVIPSTLTNLGYGVLTGMPGLANIQVAEGNPVFDSRGNCNAVIKTETNELLCGGVNTVIPEGIAIIGDNAFQGCPITSIVIPNSVREIKNYAFVATALKSVFIPSSVNKVGAWAFCNCKDLESVTFAGKTDVAFGAFNGASSLKKVTLMAPVGKIVPQSFDDECYDKATLYTVYENMTIYDNFKDWQRFKDIRLKCYDYYVDGIYYMRYSNDALWVTFKDKNYSSYRGDVKIPSHVYIDGVDYRVVAIRSESFHNCKDLKSVTLPDENLYIIQTGAFYNCTSLTEIYIPGHESDFYIDGGAFGHCSNLKTVFLGKNCRLKQQLNVFGGCDNITSVTSAMAEPPEMDNSIFSENTYKYATLFVPKNSVTKYRQAAAWKKFRKIYGLTDEELAAAAINPANDTPEYTGPDFTEGEYQYSNGEIETLGQATNDHLFVRLEENGVNVDDMVTLEGNKKKQVWVWLDDDQVYTNAQVQALTPLAGDGQGGHYNEVTYSAFSCELYLPMNIELDYNHLSLGERFPRNSTLMAGSEAGTKEIDGKTYKVHKVLGIYNTLEGNHFSALTIADYKVDGALKKDDAPLFGFRIKNTDPNATGEDEMIIANIDYAIQEASNAGWNKNERIFFYGTGGNQQSPAFYKYYRVKIQYK